jgi:hypothetical protein
MVINSASKRSPCFVFKARTALAAATGVETFGTAPCRLPALTSEIVIEINVTAEIAISDTHNFAESKRGKRGTDRRADAGSEDGRTRDMADDSYGG